MSLCVYSKLCVLVRNLACAVFNWLTIAVPGWLSGSAGTMTFVTIICILVEQAVNYCEKGKHRQYNKD